MAYDNIKLEKGLYTTSKGFTSALEELDPSENYIGTELEGLDAYERQLKRFNIKVSGTNSDSVSKFFATGDSAALFPEYVSRAVRCGIDENSIIDKIIATKTNIDALDYRAIELVSDDDNKSLADVAEGAYIPESVIKTKDTLTKLNKRGRMLVASYEAVKYQKLDLFSIALKQIGAYIGNCQINDALAAINENMGVITISDMENISYSDLVDLWTALNPYKLTTLITNKNIVAKLLKLAEFRDATAGLNFHATGNVITPIGAELCTASVIDGTDIIFGIDNTCALEMVQAGDVATDFDKLIDRQLERATITCTAGFSKMFDGAAVAIEQE